MVLVVVQPGRANKLFPAQAVFVMSIRPGVEQELITCGLLTVSEKLDWRRFINTEILIPKTTTNDIAQKINERQRDLVKLPSLLLTSSLRLYTLPTYSTEVPTSDHSYNHIIDSPICI